MSVLVYTPETSHLPTPPNESLGIFAGEHSVWRSPIHLFRHGRFTGGGSRPHGSWVTADGGERLVLHWDHWLPETLERRSWGYENGTHRLRFTESPEERVWREMCDCPNLRRVRAGRVHVERTGRLGNQLFQFAAAYALAEKAGVPLTFEPIPGFPGTKGFDFGRARFRARRTTDAERMKFNVEEYCSHLRSGGDAVLTGYHQWYALFRDFKVALRRLLSNIDAETATPPGADDLVLHVRLGDYFSPHFIQRFEYPLEDIEALVSMQRYSCLRILTDTPGHPFITRLCEKYRGQVNHGGALGDFAFMTRARRIVMSPSTYSWWASWLSDAEQIFYPQKKGIWGREPRIDIWVDDEDRYVAY